MEKKKLVIEVRGGAELDCSLLKVQGCYVIARCPCTGKFCSRVVSYLWAIKLMSFLADFHSREMERLVIFFKYDHVENTRSLTVGEGLFDQWAILGAVDLNFHFHSNRSGKNKQYNYKTQRWSKGNEEFSQDFVKGTEATFGL